MHWDGYTVFSVISGVVMVIAALVMVGIPAKDRIWTGIGGLLIGGYGIYAAEQTSGTYYFTVYIFVIPFIAVIGAVYAALTRGREAAAPPVARQAAPPIRRPSTSRPRAATPRPQKAGPCVAVPRHNVAGNDSACRICFPRSTMPDITSGSAAGCIAIPKHPVSDGAKPDRCPTCFPQTRRPLVS